MKRVEFKCLVCDRAWSRECDLPGYAVITSVEGVQEGHRWECAGAEFSNVLVVELMGLPSIDVEIEFKR